MSAERDLAAKKDRNQNMAAAFQIENIAEARFSSTSQFKLDTGLPPGDNSGKMDLKHLGVRMNRDGCPVCGYPEFTALDESGWTTSEICECCRCESGYEFDQDTSADRLMELRQQWLESEPKEVRWLGGKPDLPIDRAGLRRKKEHQLRLAGLPIPN